MKLKIIILITFFQLVKAQSYQQDWEILYKKAEAGSEIKLTDLEAFIKKYKKELGNYPDNSAQLYSLIANTQYNSGNYSESEKSYLESYRFAQSASDTSLKHIAELSLAVFCYNTNRFTEAEIYYVRCLPGMAAVYGQTSREYTQLFYDYTRLLIDLGKYEQAAPYVEALLYYYKTLDGEKNLTYQALLNSKAIVFQNAGNYPAAAEIMRSMVQEETILKLGDTLGYIITVSNLGDLHREMGQYEEALSHLKNGKRLYYQYKNLKSPETLATICNNLALCYKATGNYKEAEQNYNLALELYEKNSLAGTEPYCSTLSNKADLYRVLGRNQEASGLLIAALEIRRERFGTQSENYANAVSNLANVYFDVELYELALEKNLEAKSIYEQTVGERHQSYANCLNSLSLCYFYLKNYQLAEDYKVKAIKIVEEAVGKAHYRYSAFLISTYGLYRKTGQLSKAEKNINEALQLIEKNFGKDHELYAQGTLALAEIYALSNKFEESGALYLQSLNYYSSQVNDYFDAMGEEDQASFLQSIASAFESYNLFLINYKLSASGKDLSLHLKYCLKYQLLLKSLLANRSAMIRREIESANDEELKRAYKQWVSLKTLLINKQKSVEGAIDDNTEIYASIGKLETLIKSKTKRFSKTGVFGVEQLGNALQPGEAAVEIFKVRETPNDSVFLVKYGALIVKKGSVVPDLVIFKNGRDLDGYIFDKYSKAIDETLLDTLSYSFYFKSLEGSLVNVRHIYLSADGVFNKINFLSLYNPAKRNYMIENFEITLVSNLSAIADSVENKEKSKTASLFGYPDYDYDFKIEKTKQDLKATAAVAKRYGLTNLPKLPGTKTEVETIAGFLKASGWNVDVYTEHEASETNFRKVKSPSVLHVATHGYYLKDVESADKLFLGFETSSLKNNSLLRSGLILAGAGPSTQDSTNKDSENDGILTAYEASYLNLTSTDLVVLSACQTGLGDEMGTEGVAGLQRSLTIAGTKNILMSLWPVDDNATQYLMTEFYKKYAANREVESSFRSAQAAVRVKYPHPMYWAAFVLLKTFN